jgi:uncharacterized protein with NRDE domain
MDRTRAAAVLMIHCDEEERFIEDHFDGRGASEQLPCTRLSFYRSLSNDSCVGSVSTP